MSLATVRWDPFRDLSTIQDRLNRLFSEGGAAWGNWVPAVDIFEKDENLVLKAELPGMTENDIDIRVENGVLTLSGERKLDEDIPEQNVHRVERYHGSFTRTFALPKTVDTEKIRASYRNGILEVLLPKAEAARPKRIEIKAS